MLCLRVVRIRHIFGVFRTGVETTSTRKNLTGGGKSKIVECGRFKAAGQIDKTRAIEIDIMYKRL
jgi:hypothetical protein